MKKIILLIIIANIAFTIFIEQDIARKAAENKLAQIDPSGDYVILEVEQVKRDIATYGYIFYLEPQGYIITSARDYIRPIIAFSLKNSARNSLNSENRLKTLVKYDMMQRQLNWTSIDYDRRMESKNCWNRIRSGERVFLEPMETWPSEGETETGGWIETQWTQNAPYNIYCPLDPVTGERSYAGCPSIAMAQIVNYYRTTRYIEFNSADRYYHEFGSSRTYWIDDAAEEHDFPDFSELNAMLSNLLDRYIYGYDITSEDYAALVFACGLACEQVYSSSGSGTFGVDQAYAAYQRFDFEDTELWEDEMPIISSLIIEDIMIARPVHLAVVTPEWDSGHNLIIDGYDSDGYYHLNFGYGGSYDGWYDLPTEMPFDLTVIEGVIIGIWAECGSIAENDIGQADNIFLAYPNPFKNIININSPISSRAEIIDINGRIIRKMSIPGTFDGLDKNDDEIDAGVYFIRTTNGQESFQYKIIKAD
ncbi:MAG: C10 family peptidase [Candidatus Zixiibacteriota bacterium]